MKRSGAKGTIDLAGLYPGPARPIANPGLTRDQLLEIHRLLRLNRIVEDKLSALYRQGHITGGFFSSLGQEAISVGTAFALRPDDLLAPMIRNIGSVLARGVTPSAPLVRRQFQLLSGHWPKSGEVLVGRLAAAKLQLLFASGGASVPPESVTATAPTTFAPRSP